MPTLSVAHECSRRSSLQFGRVATVRSPSAHYSIRDGAVASPLRRGLLLQTYGAFPATRLGLAQLTRVGFRCAEYRRSDRVCRGCELSLAGLGPTGRGT